MKHILQVLKFEYLNCIKNKAFIITTIVIMILILGMSFVPAIIMDIAESDGDSAEGDIIGIVDNAYHNNDLITQSFQKIYPHGVIIVTEESMEEVKAKVDKSEYEFAVVLNTPISFTYVTKNNSLMSEEVRTYMDLSFTSFMP